MVVQQNRGVFDKDGIGVVGKSGQANDVEARVAECLLIGGVLLCGASGVDGLPFQVGQGALGDSRTYGAGECASHGH